MGKVILNAFFLAVIPGAEIVLSLSYGVILCSKY
jgi:hypothetical protein